MGVVECFCVFHCLGWTFSPRAQRVRSLHIRGLDVLPRGMS